MDVLVAHNSYKQPGGEDEVFRAETSLLEAHGHRVVRYSAKNERVDSMNRLALAQRTIWSRESYRDVRECLRRERPHVFHVHNTLPLLSPSVYYAAQAERIPVVQTLHNYRLLCPSGLLLRDGRICEECVGKVPIPSVIHACYRGSRAATGVVATMLTAHRALGTWRRTVDVYVALTEFARSKFIASGLLGDRVLVKPNFVDPDPGEGTHTGGYALFVGRLAEEKGIRTMLEAGTRLSVRIPLKIVGGGPLEGDVHGLASSSPVEWVGHQPKHRVIEMMQNAAFLVFPSVWYEGFPVTIAEAYATGLAVIGSRCGSVAEIITDGVTGRLFVPGEAADLAEKVVWAATHPDEINRIGRNARAEYEAKYTANRNCDMLVEVYRTAIEVRRARERASASA